MRTRLSATRERSAQIVKASRIRGLLAGIRRFRKEIDEANAIWLRTVEKEARGATKIRYAGNVVPTQELILELEWTAVKYYGRIRQAEEEIQALESERN